MEGTRWGHSEVIWWATVSVLVALLVMTFIVSLADKRLIDGVGVWVKPMKFQLSLAVHFATLALIAGRLSEDWRAGAWLLAVAIVSVVCTAFEVTYIMVQAARQQASHFCVGTPFCAAMYTLMALGAVVIICAAGAVAAIVAIDSGARITSAVRLGTVVGLVGGTVLTLIVAFTMGGRMSHSVGLAPVAGSVIPITGWSTSAGDLRVPHFFATHMIQALPLSGLAVDAVVPKPVALVFVLVAAALWTALTLWTYQQALAGVPFQPWG